MGAPRVSDHALVRFMERAGQFNIEVLRAELERQLARAHTAARRMGDSDYLVRIDGMTFVVRGEVVTTVLEKDNPGARAHSLGLAETGGE